MDEQSRLGIDAVRPRARSESGAGMRAASFPSFAASLLGRGWHGLLLFILGTAWGLQFVLLKIATDAQLDELGILTMSMVLLAAAYLLAMACRRAWFRPTRRHLRFFVLSGLLGFVLPLGAVVLAARYLSAGLIVLYESLTPVLTVAIALALRTEALSRKRITAVGLGMLGVVLVFWPELVMPGGARLEGLIIALIIFLMDTVSNTTLQFIYDLNA